MANLSVNTPYIMKLALTPIYNRNIMHRGQHLHKMDLSTLGLMSKVTPSSSLMYVPDKINKEMVPSADIVKDNKNGFQIYLDVGLFTPKELSVKIENDHIIVEGKHEVNHADDVGFVYRHFIRRYELPVGYNPEDIVSKLSSNGVVSITMPKNAVKPNEYIQPIHAAGPHDVF